ncbi:MAG: sterol desaturase family protein [Pseudomonadales bacterium]
MGETLIQYEPIIRLTASISIFALIALWELLSPRRELLFSRRLRWSNNIALTFVNTITLRLLVPVAAVSAAYQASEHSWGLLNTLNLPPLLSIVIALLLLDLAIYLQHMIFHKVPVFWRLHRMHHTDMDFDLTSAARFHPLEMILSMFIKIAVVMLLGAPVIAVILFEVILNATATFNHGNIRLPGKLDSVLRIFIVTPDMHRVHHSIYPEETNSNYGFNLPWWDRLLGTYCAQPRDGHLDMTIGLNEFRSSREIWLDRLLRQPFIKNDVTQSKT